MSLAQMMRAGYRPIGVDPIFLQKTRALGERVPLAKANMREHVNSSTTRVTSKPRACRARRFGCATFKIYYKLQAVGVLIFKYIMVVKKVL